MDEKRQDKNREAKNKESLDSISPERLEMLADLATHLAELDKLARTKPKGKA